MSTGQSRTPTPTMYHSDKELRSSETHGLDPHDTLDVTRYTTVTLADGSSEPLVVDVGNSFKPVTIADVKATIELELGIPPWKQKLVPMPLDGTVCIPQGDRTYYDSGSDSGYEEDDDEASGKNGADEEDEGLCDDVDVSMYRRAVCNGLLLHLIDYNCYSSSPVIRSRTCSNANLSPTHRELIAWNQKAPHISGTARENMMEIARQEGCTVDIESIHEERVAGCEVIAASLLAHDITILDSHHRTIESISMEGEELIPFRLLSDGSGVEWRSTFIYHWRMTSTGLKDGTNSPKQIESDILRARAELKRYRQMIGTIETVGESEINAFHSPTHTSDPSDVVPVHTKTSSPTKSDFDHIRSAMEAVQHRLDQLESMTKNDATHPHTRTIARQTQITTRFGPNLINGRIYTVARKLEPVKPNLVQPVFINPLPTHQR